MAAQLNSGNIPAQERDFRGVRTCSKVIEHLGGHLWQVRSSVWVRPRASLRKLEQPFHNPLHPANAEFSPFEHCPASVVYPHAGKVDGKQAGTQRAQDI